MVNCCYWLTLYHLFLFALAFCGVHSLITIHKSCLQDSHAHSHLNFITGSSNWLSLPPPQMQLAYAPHINVLSLQQPPNPYDNLHTCILQWHFNSLAMIAGAFPSPASLANNRGVNYCSLSASIHLQWALHMRLWTHQKASPPHIMHPSSHHEIQQFILHDSADSCCDALFPHSPTILLQQHSQNFWVSFVGSCHKWELSECFFPMY